MQTRPATVRRRPASEDRTDAAARARHPVGVAQRHQPDRRVALDRVGVPVGDPRPGRQPLDEHEPAGQRHRGPQPVRRGAGHVGHRREPVDSEAGADQVEVLLGRGQRRGRVGQVAHLGPDAGPLGHRQRVGERRGLARDRRVPRRVRVGEVRPDAHHPHGVVGLGLAGGVDHVGPVGHHRATTAEAGVDLEVHPRRRTRLACRRRDRLHRPHRAGREVDVGADPLDPLLVAPGQPGQHPRPGHARSAQRQRLLEQGGAEPGRAALHRGLRRGHQPVAVAVGLDHGHHLGAGPAAQRLDVRADRPEVDLHLRVPAGGHPVSFPEPGRPRAGRPARRTPRWAHRRQQRAVRRARAPRHRPSRHRAGRARRRAARRTARPARPRCLPSRARRSRSG